MLLGRGSFTQDTGDLSVLEVLREGRNQEIRAGLRTVEAITIIKIGDLPFFEKRLQHLINLYTT